MSKQFDDGRPRCPVCEILLNMPMPYCSQVCEDSKDAAMKREYELVLGRGHRG